MNLRDERLSACEGKFRHATRAAALRAVRRRRDGRLPRPYRCRFCRAWHIGSTLRMRVEVRA